TAGAGMRRCLLGWVGAYRWPDCCKRESSCELNQASRSFFNCVWHEARGVIAAGVTVVSAVGRRRRMMVFSGVASQCEERGAMPAGTNFEIAATIVPAGTLVPPKRFSVRSVAHAATPPQSNSGHHHPEKFRLWLSGQARRVTKPIRRETIAAAIVALPLRITSRAPSNGWGILRVLVS